MYPSTRARYKKQLNIHPFAPTILFIGRMAYQKGPDLLVDAHSQVKKEYWGVQVIMAGDGGMRSWLQDQAGRMDLPVQFTGYISDAEYVRLLHAADLVVIPSRNEPFGIALPEAWSAGKPVVACDVGGLHENIYAYQDGIKVPVSDQSLAWGICDALDSPIRMNQYGRAGRSKVYNQFRWEGIADQIDTMHQNIAS